jgi:equilibrative nucleoside transporter 1/2/3
MFLAAAPYFQKRFESDDWILENFQSAIISVSTFTNFMAMLILTNIQYTANYPFRINSALMMNVGIFALLTMSTKWFLDVSAGCYLAFLLVMVALSAWAAGLIQNGAFAFAASFGKPEYTQAVMAGQGVAGVLPAVVQLVSVLAVPPTAGEDGAQASPPRQTQDASPPREHEVGSAAFMYFLTAVAISIVAFIAFIPLVRRHNHLIEERMMNQMAESLTSVEEAERAARKVVGMAQLLRKLHWLSAAVFMCFAVAMFFPVFTAKIVSVRDPSDPGTGQLFQHAAFISLGFLSWNMGDLLGRMSTMLPLSLRHRPAVLFGISLARVLFLPLYMLCNIRGQGAVISSDAFYLLLVQFPYGLTNGWLGSSCMMAAGEWVDEGEQEAAGGFMGLCLVAGLTVGSLLSFTAAGI